jgi:hypothetical protein
VPNLWRAALGAVSAMNDYPEDFPTVDRRGRPVRFKPVLQRMLERTEIVDMGYETPCWIWTGATAGADYGKIGVGSRAFGTKGVEYLHRISHVVYRGPIPPGHEVDHRCRVHRCWCPDHIEAVTDSENNWRGLLGRLKTHCAKGHPYDDANTRWDRHGRRRCRACTSVQNRQQKERRKALRSVA